MTEKEPVELVLLQDGREIHSSNVDLDTPPDPGDQNVLLFGVVEPNGESNPKLEITNKGFETAYHIDIKIHSKGNRAPKLVAFPEKLLPGETQPLILSWKPSVVGQLWVWGWIDIEYGYVVRPRKQYLRRHT